MFPAMLFCAVFVALALVAAIWLASDDHAPASPDAHQAQAPEKGTDEVATRAASIV